MKRKGGASVAEVGETPPAKTPRKQIKAVDKDKKEPKAVVKFNPSKVPKNKVIKKANGSTVDKKKAFKPKASPKDNSSNKAKVPPANGVSKPPDWAKFKKEKKQLRDARRRAGFEKDTIDVVGKAKIISEQLRRKKGTVEERAKLTEELHSMLKQKNHYNELALAHDTTRIIQWLLKFSSVQIREEISELLLDLVSQMILSKYARNCVKRILKYGSAKTRNNVITKLQGNIVKFASHTMSAPILDYVYNEIASKKQKYCLQQEFYGDIYKTSKDESVVSLKDTYKNSPEMKNAMLGATKANILKVLNKNVHDCALIHAVLFEYLKECNSADRSELITTLSPLVVPLSNSKPGVKVAVMCVWHGTNKDKKIIVKVVKEHAMSLATHEHGHLLILSILASVDDTVLVTKAILSVLINDIASIAKEEWGRKVILWLVAPREKAHFHPSLVEWLDSGISQGNSKKPADQKSSELLKETLPSLCKSLQENTEFWLSNGSLSLTTVAILKSAQGDNLEQTLNSLSEYICKLPWTVTENEKEVNGIEHAGIHLSLKKLAQNDKSNAAKGEYTFGQAICKFLNTDTAQSWITTNRGCFLLVTIFENNSSAVQKSLKEILNSNLKMLKKQSTAGSKILLKNLTT